MHEISGTVVHGEKLGRLLGFPTANLDRRSFVKRRAQAKFGVWAGYATTPEGKVWKAGIVIGPLDKRGLPKIEAHLLGFSGDLYGEKLKLGLVKYIRAYKNFKKLEALKLQIGKDLKKIKSVI